MDVAMFSVERYQLLPLWVSTFTLLRYNFWGCRKYGFGGINGVTNIIYILYIFIYIIYRKKK